MKHADRNLKQARSLSARISAPLGLLLALALLLATPASAAYEQVNTFERGEGEPAIAAQGMAVNVSGAGGVPAGTLYAANASANYIVRYGPKGEFLGKWGFSNSEGVAVDQSTGNVYGFRNAEVGEDQVWVYNADGSQLIGSFGERAANEETIDESPEKIHGIGSSGIAVDSSGVVYVSDHTDGSVEARVMVFEPQSPGDYKHYVYAGRSNDIAASKFGDPAHYVPHALALDAAGSLYMVGGEDNAVYKFAPGNPATPACEIQVSSGGIEGMTVNSESGEVFYFTYKDKKNHQLAPCNAQGKFVQRTSFALTPKATEIRALAFNPTFAWDASRPPGVLYAAVPRGKAEGLGYIFAPAVVHSPSVESESVSSVTTSTVTLGAQINPNGSPTRYAFQYITEAAYQANEPGERFAGATEAPLGGAVLGSGQEALGAGVSLVGLAPDTAYRYRAIASSHCDPEKEEELCEDTGSAQAFHTFPIEAPGLPDDRAWELVSPAQKSGGEVIPAYPRIASCHECKPAALTGALGFPMQSAPNGEAVVYEGFPFSTTEGTAIFNEYISRRTASGWQTTILSPSLHSDAYGAFNARLTQGLLSQSSPTLSPDAPSGYANLYTQPTATPSVFTPLMTAEPPNRHPLFTYAGASADFSQLFFEANDALTGETPFAPEAVDGGEDKNNLYEWANGELRLVNVLPGNTESAPDAVFGTAKSKYARANLSHAISDDGSHVFWSEESDQVYVRQNGETTIAIPDSGKFLSASADGSKVLLLNGHLYDLETEETIDLTEGEGGFQGIVGQSEDLSQIYFVDTAVLTGEAENDHGAKAQAGQNNLYAWDEGAVAFIATLVANDNQIGFDGGDWQPSPVQRTAEASPNGRWVAFLSKAPLTGYDNTNSGPCRVVEQGKVVDGPCLEVFLYNSASGELICPSCNPSGTRPPGNSTLRLIQVAEGSLPQPRYLLDSGRLYFDSQDSLTPFDTNDGVEDVYQYEPEGVGSCKREGGCVSLISAGHEPIDSNFLAIDVTGKNVFFTSRDQLVLKDRDDLIDLYVAREDGGIPAETETARGECQGESCLPAAIVPNDPTPGSSSFEGGGNVSEKKAKKKAKARHKKRKQRAKKRHHKRAHKRAANHNRGGAK